MIRIPTDLVSFKSIAIVPSDIALGALGILLVIRKLKTRNLFFERAVLKWPIFLFFLAALISLAVNTDYYRLRPHEVKVSSLYLLRWLYYSIPYFLVSDLVKSRPEAKHLLNFLLIGAAVFSGFGVFQAIFLPNFAIIVDPGNLTGWDLQGNRLVSTFLDPNFAGCLIGTALAGCVAFWMEGFRRARYLVPLFGLALILTYSRGSVLAFLMAFIYLVAVGKNKRRGFATLFVVILMIVAGAPYFVKEAESYQRFTVSDESAQSRIELWRSNIGVIRDNPVWGIGFNTTPYVVPNLPYISRRGYSPGGGNSFYITGGLLTIFALTGMFGLGAYCYLLGKVIWISHFLSTRVQEPFYRAMGRLGISAIIILVISSFFTLTILYNFIMGVSWMLFGILSVLYCNSKQEKREPASIPAGKPDLLGRRRGVLPTQLPFSTSG
jgi:hypothetical protein